jgi:hypothetical protein
VDGFDQGQSASEADESGVADECFVAAQGDTFEALELADGLFDARPEPVEALWEEAAPLLGILATGE